MQQNNISSYLDTPLRGIIVVSTDASMLFEVRELEYAQVQEFRKPTDKIHTQCQHTEEKRAGAELLWQLQTMLRELRTENMQ